MSLDQLKMGLPCTNIFHLVAYFKIFYQGNMQILKLYHITSILKQ